MSASVELKMDDYLGIIRRRKWMVLGVVLACMAVSVVLCLILPKKYRSTATILVEGQKISTSYVKSGVEGTTDGRLNAIQQTVMSRTSLTKVAEQFGLIVPQMSPLEREYAVQNMRQKAKITKMRLGHAMGLDTTEGFTLTFDHNDPVVAMKVTEVLAAQFIEQDLQFREQVLEGTSGFLEQELHSEELRLEEQERAISDFRTKYMGELPQQMEANLRSLDRLQMDVNAARDNIQSAMNRVAILEKQVSDATSSVGAQSQTPSDSTSQGHGRDPLITRLAELERTLTTLSAEYRETYPDIVQTRQEIEAVKSQLAAKYGVSKDEVTPGSANLIDPMVRDLMRQRDEAKNEVGVLKERLRRLLDQIKQYEGRVERTPVREQELMILVRDYDNMQKNYQSLLDKRLNARLAENLEKRQKGEQFRILDPANLPVTPESPNQLAILLGGLVVGCGLGGGSAVAAELLRPALRREEEAERLLGVPVLAGIPSFNTLLGAREKLAAASSPLLGSNKRSFLLPYRGKNKADAVPETQLAEEVRSSTVSWNVIAKWWPNSMITEQYRVAATRLALMSREREHPVALITSSVMGEGKSTTTINLGHVFAQGLDKKTLIIDCDFKRPAVGRYLGVSSRPGLSDYWKDTCGIDACLHRVDEIPLWVLPSGTDSEQVFELSKIRQLEGLINELRPRFDQILLDAPPVFPLADLNFLSRLADMMVFVILAGKTNRDVVEKALKALRPQGQVGIILAGMESASIPHYQYHYDDRHADRYVTGR